MFNFNIKYFLLLSIFVLITSCSHDPFSPVNSGPSSINLFISIDNTNLDRLEFKSLKKPAEITKVTVNVTGPDMESVSRQLNKVGNSFSASLEVPKGNSRVFLVQAFDQNNIIQYEGETTKNIQADEESVSLTLTPQYPESVVLSVVNYTNTSVSLSWSRNEDDDFYAYLILGSESPQINIDTDAIISITDRDQTTFTDTGLSPNTTYYYQVLVVDTELLYRGSNVESITTKSGAATALINDIWVDHNYMDYDINGNYKNGMLIHVDFDINGQQGATCLLTCWFYYASGSDPLKDFNGYYRDTAGNVSVQESFVPSYTNSNYPDYKLFIPYDELHMSPGTSDLRFSTGIFDSIGNLVAYENADIDQYFSFIQTANSIIVQPKSSAK